jgi:hypothetical protein
MDEQIASRISELVEREHQLRTEHAAGEPDEDERARLAAIEVELDQCWDLLRQRRARREAHQSEGDATVRPAGVVEGYQQ